MARVFLSYRRADGPYAVGWIAERLARLDEVTEVRTAFYDTELRAGDEFPAALDAALDACDVLVAVIGPRWRGERQDGSARILDPDDWVGREITAALERDIVVLPVLVDGAEPPSASSLRPEHARLSDLHSLRFDRSDDLDTIADHLRSHLDEIDRRRAAELGLREPIELPPIRPSSSVLALALLAGIVAGVAAWWTIDWFAGGAATTDADATGWKTATTATWSLAAASAVLGADLLRRDFSGDVRLRWGPVALTIGAIGLIMLWFGVQPGGQDSDTVETGMWTAGVVALTLATPWAVALTGAAWTVSLVDARDLGARARVIGRTGRATFVATTVLGVLVASGTVSSAYGGPVADRGGFAEQLRLLGAGALMSVLLTVGLIWARTRLERSSLELATDLDQVPPVYRRHAEPLLVTEPIAPSETWIVGPLLLPTIAGVVAALVIAA